MFHCRTHTCDVDERGRRGEETGWWRKGEENLIPIDKDLFNPLFLCSIAGHTHGMVTRGRRQGGDEREEKRGDRVGTRRKRELYANRQGLLTHYMFHCRTHTWDGDERGTRGEETGWWREGGDDLDDEDGGSTLVHCVIQCLCVHLDWGAVSMTTTCVRSISDV